MTRARGSDEVEEEGAGAGVSSTLGASSFKDLFLDWDGPDVVFNTVSDWTHDFDGHHEKSTVANFFQYCLSAVASNWEEDYELSSGCRCST